MINSTCRNRTNNISVGISPGGHNLAVASVALTPIGTAYCGY